MARCKLAGLATRRQFTRRDRAIIRIRKFGEQVQNFAPCLASHRFQRLGAREHRFGFGTVRDDDRMAIQQKVEILDLGHVAGEVDAVNFQQLLGGDQNLVGAEHALRDPGPDQNPMLGRHDQIGMGLARAQGARGNPDRTQMRCRGQRIGAFDGAADPDDRLQITLGRQNAIADAQILDADRPGRGLDHGPTREARDRHIGESRAEPGCRDQKAWRKRP